MCDTDIDNGRRVYVYVWHRTRFRFDDFCGTEGCVGFVNDFLTVVDNDVLSRCT